MKNKKILFYTILTLLTLSIFALGYLTKLHFELKAGLHTGKSICNLGGSLNCESVNVSAYSSFLNIPISLWGTLTLFITIVFLFLSKNTSSIPTTPFRKIFLTLTYISLTSSIVMAVISTFLLKQFCLFCVSVYVTTFINAILATLLYPPKNESWTTLIADIFEKKSAFFLVLLIPIGSWLTNAVLYDTYKLNDIKQLEAIASAKVAAWKNAPKFDFNLNTGLIQNKQDNSPFTIVEFADFRCPHCKHASPEIQKFVDNNPSVQFIFKFYPLDGVCNPALGPGGSGVSCKLAYLSFCADKIANKGWEAHHAIYDHQEEINSSPNADNTITGIIQTLNLDSEKINQCMNAEDTFKAIQEMAKEGQTAQVKGTPSVFINGKVLEGGQIIQILQAAFNSISQ